MELAEALAGLETPLPAGSLIVPEDGGAPVLWLTDRTADFDLWRSLVAEHPRSGLWPLVLEELSWNDDEFRPWESGELYPRHMSAPGHSDPATVLDVWWQRYAGPEDGSSVTAPYGPDWPGLAERALYEGRDLKPTLDTRAVLKAAIASTFDLTPAQVDRVFPGSAGIRALHQLMG